MTTPRSRLKERDQLVISHVGLVKAMAQRLAQRLPSQVEMGDLISVGVLGLIDAAGRYKASTGVPFDAFARRRVQGAMLDALRDLDWAPRSLRKLRRELDSTIARLRHEFGREPSEEEIGAAMGLSEQDYQKALEQVRTLEVGALRQLDAPTPDGTTLIEVCIDPGEGPEARLEKAELREHLARALTELPDRERQILALYYEEELTMAEIGEVIGVCESRVSQLRSLALSRLRASLRASIGLPDPARAARPAADAEPAAAGGRGGRR
ncbi:MAG: FliA/WhiG family RNA polymerase sigma factor [Acidobacteriota bacterium]|nr:FliA/WhiG family RNA polymerase sigma factor [Acidobacteriota bacterium]